jgi:hypothetical protein
VRASFENGDLPDSCRLCFRVSFLDTRNLYSFNHVKLQIVDSIYEVFLYTLLYLLCTHSIE